MAIDTQSKRRKALDSIIPWIRALNFFPSGTSTKASRAHIDNVYNLDSIPVISRNQKMHYAIYIDTGASSFTGWFIDSGKIRLVTDRPYYSHSIGGTIPTWGTNEKRSGDVMGDWITGILTKDSFGDITRNIDITESGNYGSISGFTCKLVNTNSGPSNTKVFDYLKTNSIQLVNKNIEVYAVINDVFYQIYEGKIVNNPYTETDYALVCEDISKNTHKNIPQITINKTNFSNVPNDNDGKLIPVALGEVPYANLYNVTGTPIKVDIMKSPVTGEYRKVTGANAYVKTSGDCFGLTLLSGTYYVPDSSLNGKYLFVEKGPDVVQGKLFKIKSQASATSVMSGNYTCNLLLEEPFYGISDTTFTSTYRYPISSTAYGPATANTMYFSVISMDSKALVSQQEIKSFSVDTDNKYFLNVWDKDKNKFNDVSQIIDTVEVGTTLAEVPFPHIALNEDYQDSEAGVEYFEPIYMNCNGASQSYATDTSLVDLSHVDDRSRQTYSLALNVNTQNRMITSYDFVPPNKDLLKGIDTIYICPDFGVICKLISGTSNSYYWELTIDFYDNFGVKIDASTIAIVSDFLTCETDLGNPTNYHCLPNAYYVNGGNSFATDSDFGKNIALFSPVVQSIGDAFKLSSDTVNYLKSDFIGSIKVTFTSRPVDTDMYRTEYHYMYDIGLFGVKSMNTLTDDTFTRVDGEVYTVDTTKNSTNTLPYLVSKILRDYDGIDMSNTELGTLFVYRSDWYTGRQLKDQKNSLDYLIELCKQNFFAMYYSRIGILNAKAWTEAAGSWYAANYNYIVRDSITSFEQTSLTQCYNEFFLEYNYNPATSKFNKTIFITKVDQAAFPDFTEDWTTYAGGFTESSSTDYTFAKGLWDACHASYLITNKINKAPDELSKLYWCIDRSLFGVTDTVTTLTPLKYLTKLIAWVSKPHDVVTFSLPLDSDTVQLDLLSKVSFQDSVFTNSNIRGGYIQNIKLLPEKDIMEIQVILNHV